MYHLFRETIGRQCTNPKCIQRLQRVDDGEHCESCGQRLVSKNVTNWRVVGPSLAVLFVLLVAAVYLTRALLEWRAAAQEEELIAEATQRLQKGLQGVTASDVDAIAETVQVELKLTDEQRQLILERSKERIGRLPRDLTPDVEDRLEALVRDLYRDGSMSSDEEKKLNVFAQRERLAQATVSRFESGLRSRIESAHQSLARGKEFLREEKYAEARLEILRATQSDPRDAVAWANLGVVNIAMGRLEEARNCYSKALQLDSGNWVAHYNLGLLSERNGDRETAFRHFEQALAALGPAAARERKAVIENLLHEPALAELRQDSRFPDLLSPASLRGQGGG